MDKARAHVGHLVCHRLLAPLALHELEGFQETRKVGIAAKSRQDVIKASIRIAPEVRSGKGQTLASLQRARLTPSGDGRKFAQGQGKREESLGTALHWFILASDGKWLWASAIGHPETKTSEVELPLQICEDDTWFTPTEFSPKLLCESF